MSYRVTEKELYAAVERLNEVAGTPTDPSARGSFYLQGAYGGWQLQRNRPDGRGCESITSGYVSKRELYDLIAAYRNGYAHAQADRHLAVFGGAPAA